mmetsp:Transcript_4031/g.25338  ORF Transcript_4031/g.25338 Transcript_4031/m.25338 type:complete len:164 (-) Transcript_4031:2345-2836(-)
MGKNGKKKKKHGKETDGMRMDEIQWKREPLRLTQGKKAAKRKNRTKKRSEKSLPTLQELSDALPHVKEQEEHKVNFTNSKIRTELVVLESARLRGVHNSATFRNNPLQAARKHLESTLPKPEMRVDVRTKTREKKDSKTKKKKQVSAEERLKIILEHEASRMR